MIKKYKQYIKESLLNKLEGPTEEEIFNSVKDLNPDEMLLKACKSDLINLAKYAIEK